MGDDCIRQEMSHATSPKGSDFCAIVHERYSAVKHVRCPSTNSCTTLVLDGEFSLCTGPCSLHCSFVFMVSFRKANFPTTADTYVVRVCVYDVMRH